MSIKIDFENARKSADEFFKKGDYESAFIYYEKCVELEPQNAMMYTRLGHVIKKMGTHENFEKQIEYYKKALEIDPEFKPAIRNLAFVYSRTQRYDEALECFKKLFELGAIADDYFFYACLKIKLKDFDEGWEYYEYRFEKKFGATPYPKIEKPRWEGQEIKDKILLIHYEQGFGDSIQFCRYFEQVKPLVSKIVFRVQDELFDLMKQNLKGIEVVSVSTPLDEIEFDYHIPIMSLPLLLKIQADNIPFSEGYIKADEEKIEQYRKKYFDSDCLKVGISYNGAPFGNKRRNVNLKFFYPLAGLNNVKIYSFQKGFGSNQLDKLPTDVEMIDLGSIFNDFSDTAAAMENLDLFVTSDNSVFNLAGAMGKKTFVLLSKDAEWRWFLDDEITPWYDSVKIFKKQDENEQWSVQMEKVVEVIKNEFLGQ